MAIKDNLEIYDEMMVGFARSFVVDGGNPETQFATPDRPLAYEESSDDFYRSVMMRSNLIVSVTRLSPTYNPNLRQDQDVPLTPTIDGRFMYSSKFPRPYIIQYQFDCRSRTRKYSNLWSQWITFGFNPYSVFYIDFGPFWNTMDAATKTTPGKTAVQIHTILRGLTDNSDLQTGEKERFIRWTATIEIMNAWMFPVPELDSDVPDPFGMISIYKVVRDVRVDLYTSPRVPPIPNPALPGVQYEGSVRRAVVDPTADMPVESSS